LEVSEERLSRHNFPGSIDKIKKFDARRKLKLAITAVVWSVGTAFCHEKISDLFKLADRKDDEKSMKIEDTELSAVQKANYRFSIIKSHTQLFEDMHELGEKIHRVPTRWSKNAPERMEAKIRRQDY
jgi:hypothetical protein